MNTPGSRLAVRSRQLAGVLVAALMSWLIGGPKVLAQNINWVGGTSTDWNTATNWDLDVVPTSSNNITIDTNSGNQPVVSTGSASGNIIVGNTTASGANTLLTISGGTQFSSNSFLIGNTTGSTGAVLVTDVGTVLNTPVTANVNMLTTVRVGGNGTGSLTVANGAVVNGLSVVGNTSGGTGTVLVTGDGSVWNPGRRLFAGVNGASNITLAEGGIIATNSGDVFISGNNSQFTVTGQAASGNHSTVDTGFTLQITGNNNTLTVSNGGQVSATTHLQLSGNATTVLVTDPGSEMVSVVPGTPTLGAEGFYVGAMSNDSAQLTIANGANLTTNFNYIGYLPNSFSANCTGGVTITGSGSVWNATGNIVVGNGTDGTGSVAAFGTGFLTLANGGSINITSGNIILGQSGGKGTLNLNDGAFFQDGNANGSLVLGSNSTINWNGGIMQVTRSLNLGGNMTMTGNGCIFDTNGFNVTFSSALIGTGNLTKNGNGNLNLSLASNGTFYTGNTTINAGTLTISTNNHGQNFNTLSTNIADNATLIFGGGLEFIGNYTGNLSGNGNVDLEVSNVTMLGAGNFTGNIEILGGSILTLAGDTSQMAGNLGTGQSFGFITFAQNHDTTYAGNISGDFNISKSGTGNLTLSGNLANTTPVSFQVNSGNIIFTGDTSQFQGGLSLVGGTNATFSQSTDSNWNFISGSGNLIQSGTGTVAAFFESFNGNLTVNSGVLITEGQDWATSIITDNSALVFAPPFDDGCPAVIAGTGSVTINATGNLTLTGNNTYTGATTINSGTLLIDGQLVAASNVQVNSGGALGGNGTVHGSVSVSAGGALIPGDNGNTIPDSNNDGGLSSLGGSNLTFLGTLSINSLSLNPAATLNFDLTDPGNYSNLSVTDSLAETGNVVINLDSGFQAGSYQLITSTGGLSNDFSNITITGVYSTALTDSGGVWTGSTTGVNFAFHAATGQLVVNYTIVPLSPTGNTSFSISDPGNVTPLSVNGTLAEAGNLVLNLSANLYTGTYQLITSNGGTSNNFANVTLTGLYSGALTNNDGVWSGNISGATFTFNAATGQLVISTPLPSGISTTRAAWLQQYFTVPQLLDYTVSGDDASPAGDGIPNLIKYALNLNPWVDGQAGLPQVSTDGVNLLLVYTAYQTDLNYNVEASTDLATWSSDGVNYDLNGEQFTAYYPLPASGSAFLHLVISPIDDDTPTITSADYSSSLSNLTPAETNEILQSASANWAQQDPQGFTQGSAEIGATEQSARGSGSGTPTTTSGGRRGGPPPTTSGQP